MTKYISCQKLELVPGLNVRSPRNVQRDLDSLVAAFQANAGVQPPDHPRKIPPLLGHFDGGKFMVASGARRTTAARRAAKESGKDVMVEVTEEPAGYTDLQRLIDVRQQNAGLPLDPMETAQLFLRLKQEHRMNNTAIAAAFDVTRTTVANHLLLLEAATPSLRTAVERGKVSPTLAIGFVRSHKSPEDIDAALTVTLSAADAAGKPKATAKNAPPKKTPKKKKHAVTFDCRDCGSRSRATLRTAAEVREFRKLYKAGTAKPRCDTCTAKAEAAEKFPEALVEALLDAAFRALRSTRPGPDDPAHIRERNMLKKTFVKILQSNP